MRQTRRSERGARANTHRRYQLRSTNVVRPTIIAVISSLHPWLSRRTLVSTTSCCKSGRNDERETNGQRRGETGFHAEKSGETVWIDFGSRQPFSSYYYYYCCFILFISPPDYVGTSSLSKYRQYYYCLFWLLCSRRFDFGLGEKINLPSVHGKKKFQPR